MDDLDSERCQPQFAAQIEAVLDTLGLHWDGAVLYQSARAAPYREALAALIDAGCVYVCHCSRQMIQKRGLPTGLDGSPVYDGLCRHHVVRAVSRDSGNQKLHVRVDGEFRCTDGVCGSFVGNHSQHTGDFAIMERSGRATYHLATVVDDHASGITQVVRGADLLGCTPKQDALYAALGWLAPNYAHVPLVLADDGTKLSKQTGARALSLAPADAEIWNALVVLGQEPPAVLRGAAHAEVLAWAVEHWRQARVPVSSWIHKP